MKILNRVQKILSGWPSDSVKKINRFTHRIFSENQGNHGVNADPVRAEEADADMNELGDEHLSIAKESISRLLNDKRVPQQVRESLQADFQQVEKMLEKIEHEHIHISVLGRVSVGKSSLLNSLMGQQQFSISPLHGETRQTAFASCEEYESQGIYFIDTPGINEVDGAEREKLAHEVATRSDIILFVVDGDMTDTEYQALKQMVSESRTVILVLNKEDRYTREEKETLLTALQQRVAGLVDAQNVVTATARMTEKHYLLVDEQGNETEICKTFPPDTGELKERLWSIVNEQGKTLSAINASLFAGQLSDQVSERIMLIRKDIADKLIQTYCVSKGVAVAINPVPVVDLISAGVIDVTLVVHLSRIYGLPLTKSEAGSLIKTIGGQMMLLLGTIWGIHFISTALKLGTGGLSTVLTASAQGAVAYCSTLVVGKAAQQYLKQGKSWGEGGAKQAVRNILDSLDRDSILQQAKR